MITYVFTLLSVAAICQSQDSELPGLPTPILTGITTFNPTGFSVEWAPVVGDDKNPIDGFMAKVWEIEKEVSYAHEEIDGLGKVLVKTYLPNTKPLDEIPETEPLIQAVGANETTARFENIKPGEDYQIRVLAYNDGEDGPYSNVLVLKIGA